MKYYLIAGEASGDLHASHLMRALQKRDPQAEFRFWGGAKMQAVGGTLVTHYKELAYMGFWEVMKNLTRLSKFIKKCQKDLLSYQPDVLILVDYSGFNLRIAPFAYKRGIPVHYYIAPKVWAWHEKRVEKIKKYIDALYVIFPFEKTYFEKKHAFSVHYVGNPLQDVIQSRKPVDETAFRSVYQLGKKPVIALLPGSRDQEIAKNLPVMLPMTERFPEYQFVIAGAPNRDISYYQRYLQNFRIAFVPDKTYDLLQISYAAVVTSGTATLETALFKVPQVVCYKTSKLTYYIAKNLISSELKYISLVNLVAEKKVVTELIQRDCNLHQLEIALEEILQTEKRHKIFEDYYELEYKLGTQGASEKTARILQALITKNALF